MSVPGARFRRPGRIAGKRVNFGQGRMHEEGLIGTEYEVEGLSQHPKQAKADLSLARIFVQLE